MMRELRNRLIEAATQEDAFVHYTEAADILGIHDARLDQSYALNHALEEISTYEHDNGRPMLTVVVVRSDDFMPGSGFFTLAKRLGNMRAGEDADAFFLRELSNVRRYWGSHRASEPSHTSLSPAAYASEMPQALDAEPEILLYTTMEPRCSSGRHLTEKLRTPENARLYCSVRRRRTRLLPLNVFRTAAFTVLLRDAATEDLAKEAMKEGRGRLFLRGKSRLLWGRTVTAEMVIQEAGEYYLEITWGSLIRSWEVVVAAPLQ